MFLTMGGVPNIIDFVIFAFFSAYWRIIGAQIVP